LSSICTRTFTYNFTQKAANMKVVYIGVSVSSPPWRNRLESLTMYVGLEE